MEQVKEFYEQYWRGELPPMKFFGDHPTIQHAVDNLPRIKKWLNPGNTLDYGCGEGHLVSLLQKTDGVDISEEAIVRAKKLYPEKYFFTIEQMPYLPYDNIVSGDVFEHIFDFDEVFEFINPHLKTGGRLMIATNEMCFLKMVVIGAFFMNTFFHPYSPHIRYFTRKTLADLLISKGYKIIHYENRGKYFGIMSKGLFMVAEKL